MLQWPEDQTELEKTTHAMAEFNQVWFGLVEGDASLIEFKWKGIKYLDRLLPCCTFSSHLNYRLLSCSHFRRKGTTKGAQD